jgi:hypothetical protein
MAGMKDLWIGDKPMCLAYPMLFDLCNNKKSAVYEMAQKSWVVPFRIRLQGS